MHGYDVHKALYIICDIQDPWVRCSDTWVGQISPYIKLY